MGSAVLIFLDGVGLGGADSRNPLFEPGLPRLRARLGRALVRGCAGENGDLLCRELDATLGVLGLPQSATGQTALFTGLNAPAHIGGHRTGYPSPDLIEMLREHSLFVRARAAGFRPTFANAYSELYWELVAQRRLRPSVTTWMNRLAGLPFRTFEHLMAGRALLWDITHTFAGEWTRRHRRPFPELPPVEPEEAARRLLSLLGEADLVLFESFLTDLVGHRRLPPEPVLDVLDRFLDALLAGRPPETTLIVTSDHGNMEDLTTRLHTRNPVPLLTAGPGAAVFREATSLLDLTPGVLKVLRATPSAVDGLPE
jgi:2,3-bisphosphoglycerate-independent phosphoglycerate mutase